MNNIEQHVIDDVVFCPYCNKKAKWVQNKVIYGKNYGQSYMCWFCFDCRSYVGCHMNTKSPLGVMANERLRKLRMKAHLLFDQLWKSKRMKRKEAYSLLRDKTGVKHIAWTNEEECQKVIDYFENGYVKPEEVK